MADNSDTQTHNNESVFHNPWQGMFDEQMSRMNHFYDELAKFETQGVERATSTIDEMAKLTKESFLYAAKLQAEWRRMSIEASRKAADMMNLPRV